jgi:nucleotide-binding universal stress UspA family protein
MAAGILLYVLYRRRARLPLLRPAELTTLPKAVTEDVDYERILVPVLGTRLTDEMVVLACQLATEQNATMDALYVIEVPMELAVDTPRPEERRKGKKVLDLAKKVAEDFGVELWPHIAQARSPGKAIVETAEEWDVDVIVLGAPRKRRMGGNVFGRTVTYVLQNAPCEVIVNLVPADYPMEGSAAELEAAEAEATEPGEHASKTTETREGADEATATREGAPGDEERERGAGGSTGDGDDRPGPARAERK